MCSVIKNKNNKPFWRKYTLAVIIILLLITSALAFIWFTQEQKPDPASEKIIREIAAKRLNKDPNELTDEDFTKITECTIGRVLANPPGLSPDTKQLTDIKLLKKFTNLKSLNLIAIPYPKSPILKWMKFLAKLGIFDVKNRFVMDLSPLKSLSNLEELDLTGTPVKNIKPLAGLKKLKTLNLISTNVTDLKPIKRLTNLQKLRVINTRVSSLKPLKGLINLEYLGLQDTQVSDLEPIKDLTKLYSLVLDGTQVSDLEPLKGLINLETLWLQETRVSDLELLKNFKKLQQLDLKNCKNITDDQVEDLQKAFPKLKIYR